MTVINAREGVHAGVATVPFAAWSNEDSIAIVGQTSMLATAKIQRSLVATNDDVYAQDWLAPLITNIVAGVGFTIVVRTAQGTFKGPVNVNWSWTN